MHMYNVDYASVMIEVSEQVQTDEFFEQTDKELKSAVLFSDLRGMSNVFKVFDVKKGRQAKCIKDEAGYIVASNEGIANLFHQRFAKLMRGSDTTFAELIGNIRTKYFSKGIQLALL